MIGVTLFSAYHVLIDPRGAISDDEALPFMISGGVCSFFSILIVVLGIFLARKPPAMAGGQPGAQGQGGMMPAGGPRGMAPPKPFPTHFLSGCASVFILLFTLGGIGWAIYEFDEASQSDRFANEDEIRERSGDRNYGLGSSFWRRRADEHRTNAYIGLGCGGFAFLVFALGIIGSVVLAKKNKQKAQAMAANFTGGGPPQGGGFQGGPGSGGFQGGPGSGGFQGGPGSGGFQGGPGSGGFQGGPGSGGFQGGPGSGGFQGGPGSGGFQGGPGGGAPPGGGFQGGVVLEKKDKQKAQAMAANFTGGGPPQGGGFQGGPGGGFQGGPGGGFQGGPGGGFTPPGGGFTPGGGAPPGGGFGPGGY
jgi:hypothetical protein